MIGTLAAVALMVLLAGIITDRLPAWLAKRKRLQTGLMLALIAVAAVGG